MMPTDWTDAQTNLLVEMHRAGETYRAIAAALNLLGKKIAPHSVRTKCDRMGLTARAAPPPWSPEEDARLAELVATGRTDEAIARAMKAEFPGARPYGRNMIIGRRDRLGLAKPLLRDATPRRKAERKAASPAPVRQGCKWITNSAALHRQRPHYCGGEATGDWCAGHKAVLHGREVGV